MNIFNVEVAIQYFLKTQHDFDGLTDGKMNTDTFDAIAYHLNEKGVSTKGWSRVRLKIAGEQLVYKDMKVYSGKIDGLDGPNTQYAREAFAAKMTLDHRDAADKAAEVNVIKPIPVKTSGKVTPVREWPKQSECSSFYGKVGTNQDTAIMPYEMRLAWEQKSKVTKFSCHKLVKAPIERIFQRTLDHYGYEKIKELNLHLWGGCLNVRKMRGGSNWSMHSWGIAVDMDPDNNQLKWGRDRATFAKPIYNKYWEFVYDEGAISLGKERNMDFMHFQFARL